MRGVLDLVLLLGVWTRSVSPSALLGLVLAILRLDLGVSGSTAGLTGLIAGLTGWCRGGVLSTEGKEGSLGGLSSLNTSM